MWVERHGESEAAMLTFYPQIELGEQGSEMIKVGFPLGWKIIMIYSARNPPNGPAVYYQGDLTNKGPAVYYQGHLTSYRQLPC